MIIAIPIIICLVLFIIPFSHGVNVGEWKEVGRTDGNAMSDEAFSFDEYNDRWEQGSSYLKAPISLKFGRFTNSVVLTDGDGNEYKAVYESDHDCTGDPPVQSFRATGADFNIKTAANIFLKYTVITDIRNTMRQLPVQTVPPYNPDAHPAVSSDLYLPENCRRHTGPASGPLPAHLH